MATKQEMAAELEGLGVEVELEDYTWDEVAEMLRDAKDSSEASTEAAEAPEVSSEPDIPEEPRTAPEEVSEAGAGYSVAQLKRYSRRVLGVPFQVLVGAQSGGYLGADDELITVDEAKKALDRYREKR